MTEENCVKNMEKFNEKPEGYDSLYPLFEAAETASLSAEDVVLYSQSEQRLYDEEIAREEYGRNRKEEGRKEGRKEGMLEAAFKIARNLKAAGMSLSQIMDITGLPADKLAGL